MLIFQLFTFVLVFFIIACQSDNKIKRNTDELNIIIQNKASELFKIKDYESYKMLIVYNKSGIITDEYYLLEKDKEVPKEISNEKIIRIPVKNVVCLSTTHIAFIDMLHETDVIKAVSGIQYIYNENLRKRIDKNKVKDVGYENSLDFELLLNLKPDLVTVYDINGTISPVINKLKKFNIPVVQINEYLESSPLGQAEWVKFFAEFLDKRDSADNQFNRIYDKYVELKEMSDSIANKPTVLVNLPWKGTWYIPGGKSNIAQLIEDAGGHYLWNQTEEIHNIPLNIEDVYLNASQADIWLNPGQANDLNYIEKTDIRLSKFSAEILGNIYNRNKRLNKFGGNDYMESGTVRPDMILKDLIKILHPYLLPEHNLFYYKKLE